MNMFQRVQQSSCFQNQFEVVSGNKSAVVIGMRSGIRSKTLHSENVKDKLKINRTEFLLILGRQQMNHSDDYLSCFTEQMDTSWCPITVSHVLYILQSF